MTDDQYNGPWPARVTQVGSIYYIEVDLPHPLDGEPVTIIVRGISDLTGVEIKPRPRRAFLPNQGANQP